MRLAVIAILCLLSSLSLAQQATTKPADYQIAEPREQTMPAFNFCYVSTRANMGTVKQAVAELMPKLDKATKDGSLKPTGAVVFIYLGTLNDYQLQIGSIVADDAKAPEGFALRKVDPFHCMTTLYSGPLATIGESYQPLITQAYQRFQPQPEWREVYLYWEGDSSPNNVVHIQVGVK